MKEMKNNLILNYKKWATKGMDGISSHCHASYLLLEKYIIGSFSKRGRYGKFIILKQTAITPFVPYVRWRVGYY